VVALVYARVADGGDSPRNSGFAFKGGQLKHQSGMRLAEPTVGTVAVDDEHQLLRSSMHGTVYSGDESCGFHLPGAARVVHTHTAQR